MNHTDAEKIASPPALSSKLERVPQNYTILDQRIFITLSARLRGERDGVRWVSLWFKS